MFVVNFLARAKWARNEVYMEPTGKSVEIPQTLWDAVCRRANDEQVKPEEVVLRALESYLGILRMLPSLANTYGLPKKKQV